MKSLLAIIILIGSVSSFASSRQVRIKYENFSIEAAVVYDQNDFVATLYSPLLTANSGGTYFLGYETMPYERNQGEIHNRICQDFGYRSVHSVKHSEAQEREVAFILTDEMLEFKTSNSQDDLLNVDNSDSYIIALICNKG